MLFLLGSFIISLPLGPADSGHSGPPPNHGAHALARWSFRAFVVFVYDSILTKGWKKEAPASLRFWDTQFYYHNGICLSKWMSIRSQLSPIATDPNTGQEQMAPCWRIGPKTIIPNTWNVNTKLHLEQNKSQANKPTKVQRDTLCKVRNFSPWTRAIARLTSRFPNVLDPVGVDWERRIARSQGMPAMPGVRLSLMAVITPVPMEEEEAAVEELSVWVADSFPRSFLIL